MPVSTCKGRRLRKESLAVTVGGIDIDAFTHKSVDDALEFVDQLTLTETQMRIAQRILKAVSYTHLDVYKRQGVLHPG